MPTVGYFPRLLAIIYMYIPVYSVQIYYNLESQIHEPYFFFQTPSNSSEIPQSNTVNLDPIFQTHLSFKNHIFVSLEELKKSELIHVHNKTMVVKGDENVNHALSTGILWLI